MSAAIVFPEPGGRESLDPPLDFVRKAAPVRAALENRFYLIESLRKSDALAGGLRFQLIGVCRPDASLAGHLHKEAAQLLARLSVMHANWQAWEAENPDAVPAFVASLRGDDAEEVENLRQPIEPWSARAARLNGEAP